MPSFINVFTILIAATSALAVPVADTTTSPSTTQCPSAQPIAAEFGAHTENVCNYILRRGERKEKSPTPGMTFVEVVAGCECITGHKLAAKRLIHTQPSIFNPSCESAKRTEVDNLTHNNRKQVCAWFGNGTSESYRMSSPWPKLSSDDVYDACKCPF